MSNTYANDTKCAEMVSTVSTLIRKENALELKNEARYISVMINGATDTSSKENEIVYTRCVSNGRPVNLLGGTSLWSMLMKKVSTNSVEVQP